METYFIAKANDGRPSSPPIYLCADDESDKFYWRTGIRPHAGRQKRR